MKNDKKVYGAMQKIFNTSKGWLIAVDTFGNQDAASDRTLEKVLECCEELKKLYEAQFANT